MRLDLHARLCDAMAGAGEAREHVYFQPPEGFKMAYPCIVYELDRIDTLYAGNTPYANARRYRVTVIDKNPDSRIPERIAEMATCTHERHFVNDNLHHDVFTLYDLTTQR